MLFSDITDCEMMVFSCIQEAEKEISLVQVMEVLEETYHKDWKRSTVCTFITHLVEKGYVSSRREGRVFYYSSAVSKKKFKEDQTKKFMNFWFKGSLSALLESACAAAGISKEGAEKLTAQARELES